MKINGKLKDFSYFLDESLTERADYGSITTGIAGGQIKKDRYFPPTITNAPSIRYKNPDLPMGQDEMETDAPSNLLYPFESVFSELVGQYVQLNGQLDTIKSAVKSPILTTEKKKLLDLSIKHLTTAINDIKLVIKNIEQITI